MMWRGTGCSGSPEELGGGGEEGRREAGEEKTGSGISKLAETEKNHEPGVSGRGSDTPNQMAISNFTLALYCHNNEFDSNSCRWVFFEWKPTLKITLDLIDWFKKLAPLSQSISKTKINPESRAQAFPRFAGKVWLAHWILWVLCVWPEWLIDWILIYFDFSTSFILLHSTQSPQPH